MTAILTGVRSYCGFDCVSLMICDVEHLFMYLLAVCISSLENFLLRFSAHFKNQIVFDLVLSCVSSLYCEYSPLTRYIVCKYFLLSHRLRLHFVDCFLCCAEAV